jgi:hypothetical protein
MKGKVLVGHPLTHIAQNRLRKVLIHLGTRTRVQTSVDRGTRSITTVFETSETP